MELGTTLPRWPIAAQGIGRVKPHMIMVSEKSRSVNLWCWAKMAVAFVRHRFILTGASVTRRAAIIHPWHTAEIGR